MPTNHWNPFDAEAPGTPPGAWDFCWLGGKLLPGVATVSCKLPSDLDVKKPDGATGATLRDKGDPPAEVTIVLNVVHQVELDALEQLRGDLRPKSKTGVRDPLEIRHPNPNFWGITAVTVKDIDAPAPSAIQGWDITITCIEWFPAPKPTPPNQKGKPPKSELVDGIGRSIEDGLRYLKTLAPSKNGSAGDNSGLQNRRGG